MQNKHITSDIHRFQLIKPGGNCGFRKIFFQLLQNVVPYISDRIQTETVLISGSDRGQEGLIKQINAPTYRGAIILCQGADSPSVCLAIKEAVSKVTGLDTSEISVLKMK